MGPCVRQEGWESRLNAVIHASLAKRFKWGQHDCSLLSLDVIDAMCNTEIADKWRGKYSNKEEAYELLDSFGGYDDIYKSYGLESVDLNYAMRGDICQINTDEAIGILLGDQIVSTGAFGIVSLGRDSMIHAWRVPCHK